MGMISALTGQLRQVEDDRVHVQAGPVLYELLVPAADIDTLRKSIGDEVVLHTIFYLEGDATRGNLEPRLIGFLRPDDRRFFERFTTVKGIGPKTALKALTEPVAQIAHAIETKDVRYLLRLKGIGKRTAELIIAQLAGKLEDFAVAYAGKPAAAVPRRPDFEEDAIEALMRLGEQRPVAERLLERALNSHPDLDDPAELVREMLRQRLKRV